MTGPAAAAEAPRSWWRRPVVPDTRHGPDGEAGPAAFFRRLAVLLLLSLPLWAVMLLLLARAWR